MKSRYSVIGLIIVVLTASASGQLQPAPLIIAHRGAPLVAPENTLASFRAAIAMKADVLEIDLRATNDGHFVVMHDAAVNRTTNGKGKVSEKRLSELRALDAGNWFDARFAGEKVPALEEVLALLDSSLLLIAELKGSSDDGSVEARLVQKIVESGKQRQVILKSFEIDVIERFKNLAPEIPRLFVYAFRIPWMHLIVGTGVSGGSVFDVDALYLQPHYLLLSASFVEEAHRRGYKVVAWGVDEEKTMRKAIEFGVDGIETDRPDLLRYILDTTRKPG
ncbi:MAG: glycerophosphodiester phosphodiesterase [Bacteroidetes bacterium]|nr:glycerophosphodiester phosphodiesterase [Bacteroidota bacterium]MCW5896663.1 glycerophosphodiester phosphodiesterase [Bacteroidota bacterium]